jgi:hypothetical protein
MRTDVCRSRHAIMNASTDAHSQSSSLTRLVQWVEAHGFAFYLFFALVFVFVTIAAPVTGFDYEAYTVQWRIVANGLDPWKTWPGIYQTGVGGNMYGPLFNLYGLLSVVDAKLPRLFSTSLWLLALWPVVALIPRSGFALKIRFWLYMATVVNPFPWGWVSVFGINDTIVGALLALAILSRKRGGSAVAGGLFGLAALLKFYPLLLAPFMAVDRRRIDLRFAACVAAVFLTGMACAYVVWGSSIFAPLQSAATRESRDISIYGFLAQSHLSPLDGVGVPLLAIQIVFAVAGLAAFAMHVLNRGTSLDGLVLGYLTIVAAYQLGEHQLYVPLVLILPLYLLLERPEPLVTRRLVLVFAAFSLLGIGFLAFDAYSEPPWIYIQKNAGLPMFIVNLLAIVALATRSSRSSRYDPGYAVEQR